MKFSHICAVLALVGVATVEAITIKDKVDQAKVQNLFNNFVSKFQRNYKSNSEYQNRLSNFMKNYQIVEDNNAHNEDFQLEANKFADLSEAEFKTMMGLNADLINEAELNAEAEPFVYAEEGQEIPASLDWRTKGVVAFIKNQASCGSCYSFSALEALQSYYHLKKGAAATPTAVINLSEQQIVDCSSGYNNNGCNGGLMSYVYNYLKAYPTMLESDYAYTARKGTCKYNSTKGQFKVTSYVNIPKNSPAALLQAVAQQPVAIALRASSSTFQLYKSGIITSTACGTSIDHAVNLIGYGTENGKDYWLLKNSWGTSWGEAGFFRILRTTANDAGICGMYTLPSYPNGISI